MKKNKTGQSAPGKDSQNERNANSAYSGSGSMQPGGDTGQPGRLSDYPEGNTDDTAAQTQSIPGNQTDQPRTEGKSVGEATDPSKLSDL